jgi:hypothetical protein
MGDERPGGEPAGRCDADGRQQVEIRQRGGSNLEERLGPDQRDEDQVARRRREDRRDERSAGERVAVGHLESKYDAGQRRLEDGSDARGGAGDEENARVFLAKGAGKASFHGVADGAPGEDAGPLQAHRTAEADRRDRCRDSKENLTAGHSAPAIVELLSNDARRAPRPASPR